MDWNGNLRVPFVPCPDTSFSFLYNYNYGEMKQQAAVAVAATAAAGGMFPMEKGMHDPKKKRLSNEQLESLENSFQEEVKLDPDRKMKLAKELGLQPRQIAVWFQNRRARWKAKQLERLYDALKQEYDAVSRDKQKLQQEVMALRSRLKEQMGKKPTSGRRYTDISGEETVESTSIPSSDRPTHNLDQIAECSAYNGLNVVGGGYGVDDDINNAVMMPLPPYWPPHLPCCP